MAPKNAARPTVTKVDTTAPEAESSSNGSALASDPLPSVHINKANLVEMKMALDEIVKKHLSDTGFTPSLLNPTIHLSLGYSSVIISLAGVLYSLRVDFEESKPVLWVSVVSYFVLQGLLWVWKKYVEKGEVFRGKRRRIVKRIETDHVQIISSTNLQPPPSPVLSISPLTRPASPTSAPSSPPTASSPTLTSTTHPASAADALPPAITASPAGTTGPTYLLELELSTTSNNGKSLIHKSSIVAGRGVGEFIDENGGVEEGEVKRWLGELLKEAGLVGAEEGGLKTE